MTLQNCNSARYYKRPHWTDFYIKFNMPTLEWIYDNGSPIGEVVRNVDDLIECDSQCNALQPAKVQVPYRSEDPFDTIVCTFANNTAKEYEYKIAKGTKLVEGQPLVTETNGKLGIANYQRHVKPEATRYNLDQLNWIYGTVTPIRDKKTDVTNSIVSEILNRGL